MLPAVDILKVNFLGTRLLTELVVEHMSAGGAIANTSSDGGYPWRKKRKLLIDFVACASFEEGTAWYEANQECGRPRLLLREGGAEHVDHAAVRRPHHRGASGSTPRAPERCRPPCWRRSSTRTRRRRSTPVEYPSGRRSTPEEQAGPLLFLNSASASYVNGADSPSTAASGPASRSPAPCGTTRRITDEQDRADLARHHRPLRPAAPDRESRPGHRLSARSPSCSTPTSSP